MTGFKGLDVYNKMKEIGIISIKKIEERLFMFIKNDD
jgi:hypothetical protein